MPDREKVTYGLRCMCYGDVECKECHYARNGSGWHDCRSNCAKDALALLKEQEVVEPKQVDLYGNDEWWGLVCVCPDCNAEWMTDKANTHFCPNCGRSVKWE